MARLPITQRRMRVREFLYSIHHVGANGKYVQSGNAWDSVNGDASISVWFKPQANAIGNKYIFSQLPGTGSGASLLYASYSDFKLKTNYGSGSAVEIADLDFDECALFTITFDHVNSIVKYYVNAQLKLTHDMDGENADGEFIIGAAHNLLQAIRGFSTNFLYYDRVQEIGEIERYYYDDELIDDGLVNYLEYKEGSGNSISPTVGDIGIVSGLLWSPEVPFSYRQALTQQRIAADERNALPN